MLLLWVFAPPWSVKSNFTGMTVHYYYYYYFIILLLLFYVVLMRLTPSAAQIALRVLDNMQCTHMLLLLQSLKNSEFGSTSGPKISAESVDQREEMQVREVS